METGKVAIIGAGVAGLACARALRMAGVDALVYDKGRGPGGRCSARRSAFGRFDHGAAFFTVRDEGFKAQTDAWREAGVIAEWRGRHVVVEDGETRPYDGDARWVGAPAMNAMVRHEAEAAGAEFGLKLAQPARQADGPRWLLRSESGRAAWAADWVVVATPAEQAAELVPPSAEGGSDALIAEADAAGADPTWTLMAAFGDGVAAPFDAASIRGDDLAWAGREASKPGRDPGARWVVHASSDWTRAHLEDDKADVIEELLPKLRALIGEDAPLAHADAHRWRYAQVATAAGSPFGLDDAAQISTCGDWRIAPRVEAAWVSGNALGQALVERLV